MVSLRMLVHAVAASLLLMTYADGHSQEWLSIPTGGIKLHPPQGYVSWHEGHLRQLARWARLDASKQPVAYLAVELQSPGKQTLEEFTQSICQKSGGKAGKAVQVGAHNCIGISFDLSSDGQLKPLKLLICQRDGMFYIFSLTAKESGDEQLLAKLLESVEFTPFEAPWRHLDLSSTAFPILDTGLTVQPIRMMRPLPVKEPGREAMMGLHDYASNLPQFALSVAKADNPQNLPLKALSASFGSSLKERLALAADPEWTSLQNGLVLLSSPCTAETMKGRLQYALAQGKQDQIVLFTFTNLASYPEPGKHYDVVPAMILKSVLVQGQSK